MPSAHSNLQISIYCEVNGLIEDSDKFLNRQPDKLEINTALIAIQISGQMARIPWLASAKILELPITNPPRRPPRVRYFDGTAGLSAHD